MDEVVNKTENEFFAWLPSAVPSHALERVKNSYKVVSSMLVQKRVLSQPLIATTQIDQVENALTQVKRIFGSKILRSIATKLLSSYLVYLREVKNAKFAQSDALETDVQDDWIRFDSTNAFSFERTSPVYCNIDGTVFEGRSWAQILVAIVEHEISIENPALEVLYKKPLYANKADRLFFMAENIEGRNCSKLSNGYWINVNFNTPRMLEIILTFCLHCGYNKNQVVLYGVPKVNASTKRESTSAKRGIDNSFDMVKDEALLRDIGLQGAAEKELIDAVQPEGSSLVSLREEKNIKSAQSDALATDVQEDWIRFDFENASSFERTSPEFI